MLKIEARAPLTHDEIEEEFDRQMEAKYRSMRGWATRDFWWEMLRKELERRLIAFDNGEIVEVRAQDYIDGGYSYSDVLMSNGTVKTICYGYAD
jgi:hypothetical protein